MKNTILLLAATTAMVTSAHAASSLLYNYQFETAAANFDSVSSSNQGSQTGGTSNTAGGATGNYVDFAGGTTVGLVSLGTQGVGLSGLDAQDFSIKFQITGSAPNSSNNSFDHPLYFSFNDTNNSEFRFNTLGTADTSGNLAFNGDFDGGSQLSAVLNGSDWRTIEIVGSASGNKTQFDVYYNNNATAAFTKTSNNDTIGSSLDVISFGGSAGEANRSFDGGIDEFTVTGIPEPSSAALLGLGGLALILRRRK